MSVSDPELWISGGLEGVSHAAARLVVSLARRAIRATGRCLLVLSGGSTPKRLYQLLAAAPYRNQIDWSRVEFFWGDERAVPPDDPESNFRLAREALLDALPLRPEQVHRMPGERIDGRDSDAAAREYEHELARAFEARAASPGSQPAGFDIVLLGLGSDGHTASLFPHSPACAETDRDVVVNPVRKLNAQRMTLTARCLNRARDVVFLVSGADKASALVSVLEGAHRPDTYPAQLIQPVQGRTHWFVDQAAAAQLSPGYLFEHRADRKVRIAPSILAADFARLGEQVTAVEQAGADRIHVDVMDGHFVPNISMGPLVVEALRTVTRLPLECHLMISEPDRYIEAFAAAGADSILVHQEGAPNLHRTLQQIRQAGCDVGVVLNPATPAALLEDVWDDIDLVLAMTVNPGFGGQKFLPSVLTKIQRLRHEIEQRNRPIELEVDGGVDAATTGRAVAAGANVLVAGSSIFRAQHSIEAALQELVAAAKDGAAAGEIPRFV